MWLADDQRKLHSAIFLHSLFKSLTCLNGQFSSVAYSTLGVSYIGIGVLFLKVIRIGENVFSMLHISYLLAIMYHNMQKLNKAALRCNFGGIVAMGICNWYGID